MRILTTFAATLFALSLILGASPASATTVYECQADITALQLATDGAEFFGRNASKLESSLLGKLEAASSKLDKAKLQDAVQKLNDYLGKVAGLPSSGPKRKIDAEDQATLIGLANDAIDCVEALIAGY